MDFYPIQSYCFGPDRFEIWCGFDYTGYDQPDWGGAAVRELEWGYQVGARGVGELDDMGKGLSYVGQPKPGMHNDDPRMAALLDKCAELKMPINVRVAKPFWMCLPMDEKLLYAYQWRLDNQAGILRPEELRQTLERACRRHPQTNFIACYLANCSFLG